MSEWRIDRSARQARAANERLVRRRIAASVCSMGLFACGAAHAVSWSPVDWNPTASLAVGATITDNAFMARRGDERGDIVLRTTPSIGVNRNGPRLKLTANYAPTILGYVNGTVGDAVLNSLISNANLELVENFMFVDGRALMSQAVLSPLGVQPVNGPTNTINRVETRTVAVSPYIQGRIPGGGSYQFRHEVSQQTYSVGGIGDTLMNRFTASASDAPGKFVVFSGEYFYTNVEIGNFASTTSKIGRLRASVVTDPEVKVAANIGYEDNLYGLRTFSGIVVGANLTWTPSDRTTFDTGYEKRYFGGSFTVNAQHRTRLASFRFRAYRSEQELQNRATGTTTVATRDVLDSSLISRIPDSTDRAREVERLMQAGGLPDALTTVGAFVSTRVNRIEGIEPSVAFTGIRNTLLLSVFRRVTTPISDNLSGGFADVFATAARIEQIGFSVSATHQFNAQFNGLIGLDVARTQGSLTGGAGSENDVATQQSFRTTLSHTLSPNTTAGVTLRYMDLNSSALNDIRERAMLITLSHTFR